MGNEKEIAAIIAANINHRLDVNHITRGELAKRVGVSLSSVGFWCTGKKIPRMDKVDKMCAIFNCDRSDILMDPAAQDSSPAVTLRPDESSLLSDYNRLNPLGRDEASKRVKELTRISEYTKKENSGSLSQVG